MCLPSVYLLSHCHCQEQTPYKKRYSLNCQLCLQSIRFPCPIPLQGKANSSRALQAKVGMGRSHPWKTLYFMEDMALSWTSCPDWQVHDAWEHWSGQDRTADASEQGYGMASYLMFTNGMEKVHIAFMLGKTRVHSCWGNQGWLHSSRWQSQDWNLPQEHWRCEWTGF